MITEQIYTSIISELRASIKGTEFEGKVYAVGGCVRDLLLQQDMKDIDLMVGIPRGDTKFTEFLKNMDLLVGDPVTCSKYGTKGIILKSHPECQIEVVKMSGSDLKEDSKSRDFTINSIYQDISSLRLLDPSTSGVQDLENRWIRTTNNPVKTYKENPIRILRVFRYMALGYNIEFETSETAKERVKDLGQVEPERIYRELKTIISYGPGVLLCLFDIMNNFRVWDYIGGKFVSDGKHVGARPNDNRSISSHTRAILSRVHQYSVYSWSIEERLEVLEILFWAIVFHDLGRMSQIKNNLPLDDHMEESKKYAIEFMERNKFPGKIIEMVIFLIQNQRWLRERCNNADRLRKSDLRKAMRDFGKYRWNLLSIFLYLDSESSVGSDNVSNSYILIDLTKQNEFIYDYELPITGDLVMKLKNIEQGPLVGKYLDLCWDKVYEYPSVSANTLIKKIKSTPISKFTD